MPSSTSENVIVVYKEVGKNPDFIKIKNTKEEFETLVGGEFEIHKYDDFYIIYKKESQNLLPNIYVDNYLKIGDTIRGTIFAVNKNENDQFETLTKEQAVKIHQLFTRKAFDYSNCDENGNLFSKRDLRRRNKRNRNINFSTPPKNVDMNKQEQIANVILENLKVKKASSSNNEIPDTVPTDEVMTLIFSIQALIIKFMKENIE